MVSLRRHARDIVDVSLKPELKATAEATFARYGKVQILVNNAGVAGGGIYGMGGTGRSA